MKWVDKSFWVLFASLSVAHIMEDMVWAVLARYTTVSMFILLGGIIMWSFGTAIILKKLGKTGFFHGHK